MTVLLTAIAAFFTAPLVALPMLLGTPLIYFGTKRYLRFAPGGHLREREGYAAYNGALAETVEGPARSRR